MNKWIYLVQFPRKTGVVVFDTESQVEYYKRLTGLEAYWLQRVRRDSNGRAQEQWWNAARNEWVDA